MSDYFTGCEVCEANARTYGVMTAECKVDELEEEVAQLKAKIADLKAADTLELDRAVQYAVALAFGQLIDALVMAHTLRSVGNEGWADIQQSEAVQSLRRLHTAFGGRIPDEVKP